MINANGERFVDEGADFRNYTYAKYGRVILDQPQQFAWQIFDQKVAHLLRDEYRIKEVTRVRADSLEQLVSQLEGVDATRALEEIRQYNAAVSQEVPFNPTIKDGRCTAELKINKSNWANTLDEPPFMAFQVTCGVTFTFGGLKVDTNAQVIDTEGDLMPDLFAAGELVGGCSTSTIREGPASWRAPSSAAPQAAARRSRRSGAPRPVRGFLIRRIASALPTRNVLHVRTPSDRQDPPHGHRTIRPAGRAGRDHRRFQETRRRSVEPGFRRAR
jgi:tricarballylate dehydrogenase